MKTMKFVTVAQAAGENESDYMLRVEKLSRNMDFGGQETVRERFTLALAVNGLREAALRRLLMQETYLSWKKLKDMINARKLARESEAVLDGSMVPITDLT